MRTPSAGKRNGELIAAVKEQHLLTIPANAGRAIVEAGAAIVCPLLGAHKFVRFCNDRGLSINRRRLLILEGLGLFAPVYRVREPAEDVPGFSIPPRQDNNWFEKGWAWDTTSIDATYQLPDQTDRTQEGYYSVFQIDHLEIVLSSMNLEVQLDSYLHIARNGEIVNWEKHGKRWLTESQRYLNSLHAHEYRRSKALLCQYISDRYYPETQGDQRTIQVPQGPRFYSDSWINVYTPRWDWHEVVRRWDPHAAERLFDLTPRKLRHAYEGMAVAQAHCDPMERWYQLIQFVAVRERQRLKGDALRAETLRSGAHMLRLLYRDLYGDELQHPNEVTGTVITHIPELEIRRDTRRYIEFVVNRYGLNPQPRVSLIVEGQTEELMVTTLFEKYFGAHPGKYGIEIIPLGGVDVATGGKKERFSAIIRLIDYLHHHQTLTFVILDNEGYAKRLQTTARNAKSIHYRHRYVTRPEYIKVWRSSFEFENFSCGEIASALTELAPAEVRFSRADVAVCKRHQNPGAALKALYGQKTGDNLKKMELSVLLLKKLLSTGDGRGTENRPIVRTLVRVARLAARNPLPTMQEVWERNQASKHLGKKRH